MTNKISIKMKGASGQEYAFLGYPWGTQFNPLGGVYALTRCAESSGNGTHYVQYVGQTGDLSERFEDHHKAACFLKHGANFVIVLHEGSEGRRLAIERDLIAGYNPPCNG